MKYRQIQQFSPIRTGSTLVYNILKIIKPDMKITKRHNFEYNTHDLFIITLRHPYNSIISSCSTYSLELNINNLKKSINNYIKNGGKCIAKKKLDNNNCLILYYEKFDENYNYIFETLENKLEIKISDENKQEILSNFSIDSVIKFTSKYLSFNKFDRKTQLHGNHISNYKGKTDYTKILNQDHITLLETYPIINKIVSKYYNV